MEVLRQGRLEGPLGDVDIAPLVYVNVRDNTNRRAQTLQSFTEADLRTRGYTVSPTPSEAGYILQVVVLSAGTTAPERARAVVAAGYGAPSGLSGEGGAALVADVLLVQRTVPSSERPSRVRLKNISRRNAVASSQMRLGLLVPQGARKGADLPPAAIRVLARELAEAVRQAAMGRARRP